MDALIEREEHEVGCFLVKRSPVELPFRLHLEGELARLGVRDGAERVGELPSEAGIFDNTRPLAVVNLASVPEAVGARVCVIDLCEWRLLGVPLPPPHEQEALVDLARIGS